MSPAGGKIQAPTCNAMSKRTALMITAKRLFLFNKTHSYNHMFLLFFNGLCNNFVGTRLLSHFSIATFTDKRGAFQGRVFLTLSEDAALKMYSQH
jgi:hypothetical protein